MIVKQKIKDLIFCFSFTAALVWVFGYIGGWGWILQLLAIGLGLRAVWEVWTDNISPEDREGWEGEFPED